MPDPKLTITDDLYHYLVEHSVRETDQLAQLREETQAMPEARMQITPEQGQFMAFLIKLINARRTLEVGVFTGYSALAVAQALPEDGELIACDISEEFTNIARRYWQKAGVDKKINLHLAPALDTLEQLLADNQHETFDFAFIDADKANYQNYYELCLQLIRQGGLIAIDNTLWNGAVLNADSQDEDTRVIRTLNQSLLSDERVDITLLPMADGVTLIRKR
ncbi:class I SAM-dependent methyltransferase [Sansalvadorimonas verongulae]|uniref:class I SAM-dependent methyltransferase n=1 Tax=Sansalvadorimonas verongulae TaxID=2172824 RepID=UPI0012BC1B6E|nr:class I SAM-dependent methyltransferase [Sansalvadorimonas verongulae]MTI11905.1 methyltransferase domain-containing protein [Sansalvadorimonas verongulae]